MISTTTSVRYQLVYNLTAVNSIEYDALTFPSIKKRWQRTQPRGLLVGIAASVDQQMVGLVIAEILLPRQAGLAQPEAEIISLFVLPEYRHQGIGTRLVQSLEKSLLAQTGGKINGRLKINYQVNDLTITALEPLLQRCKWQPPQPTFLLVKTDTKTIAPAPWLYKYPLPETFTVFPWSELTYAEAQQIKQRGGYPPALSPFEDDARLEPLNSLGLRYGGEVVGWVVTHRIAAETIRYSTLFVQPKFQKLGRGISLMAEAIKRQMASSIANGTWSVAVENQPMTQFVRRYLEPYSTFIGESRQAVKLVQPQ